MRPDNVCVLELEPVAPDAHRQSDASARELAGRGSAIPCPQEEPCHDLVTGLCLGHLGRPSGGSRHVGVDLLCARPAPDRVAGTAQIGHRACAARTQAREQGNLVRPHGSAEHAHVRSKGAQNSRQARLLDSARRTLAACTSRHQLGVRHPECRCPRTPWRCTGAFSDFDQPISPEDSESRAKVCGGEAPAREARPSSAPRALRTCFLAY